MRAGSSSRSLILFGKSLRFWRFARLLAAVLLLAPGMNAHAAAADAADLFAHPPALERDVRFWIRVYTEVTTCLLYTSRCV